MNKTFITLSCVCSFPYLNAATITISPNDLGLPDVGSTATLVPTGVFTSTSFPGLSVSISGTMFYSTSVNIFSVIDETGGTISYSVDSTATVSNVVAAHGGTISGGGARFDRVVFGGALAGGGTIPLHDLSSVSNFTDVSSGDTGRVNKNGNPGNAGREFQWQSGAPANTGEVTYSSNGTGNGALFLRIDFDLVPEPSSAMMVFLGFLGFVSRRRR